jgi:hypothetical protein
MDNQGYLRLIFEEDFFYSQIEHVLLNMAATFNGNMDRYFIIFTDSSLDLLRGKSLYGKG